MPVILSFIPPFIEKFLIPVTIAFCTYVLFKKMDEWRERRSYSKLGIAIIDSLLEEVNSGIQIMNTKPFTSALLPKNSWDGMNTVPDAILLRIIEVSKNVPSASFPPKDIRIHCKNYFTHMTFTWEQRLGNPQARQQLLINLIQSPNNYLDSATGVRTMLQQCRDLLEKNSNKPFPK